MSGFAMRCSLSCCALLALLTWTSGCGDSAPKSPAPGSNSTAAAPAAGAALLPAGLVKEGKWELRDAAGTEIFSWKPKEENSVKFYDAAHNELCKFTLSQGRLKAKSPDDKPLFELKAKDDKVMLKDASDQEIYKFKHKGTELDLYKGDTRLYRIRPEDYGFSLQDNAGEVLWRAKTKEEKLVLRNLKDETEVSTKDLPNPRGLVFFRIPELTPEQQGACVLFFIVNP